MGKLDKIKRSRDKITNTILIAVLLCTVVTAMIGHIYSFSEEGAFERLHLETQQIKNDINLQMFSDRENLTTMANFASKLYSDGDSFELLFDSFEECGLFENIGILLPDNRFVTKVGTIDAGNSISFSEEVQKGEYISGRVKDITNQKKEVVRSAVPIVADGTTVAIMYGVIELKTLEERYIDDAKAVEAQLYVLEGGNGNYIIDTKNDNLGNVSALASVLYKDEFSYDKMTHELREGKPGYSAFKFKNSNEYLYVHYAPLSFGDWQIMLSKPEQVVFAGARATVNYMLSMLMIIILIMMAYIFLIFTSERKMLQINTSASNIRKRLLEINQKFDSLEEALQNIAVFAKSRSAFFVDTHGEDYNYIAPSQADNLLCGDDRKYFIMQILKYALKHRREHGVAVYIIEITANKRLEKEMREFYTFLQEHHIKNINFAVIISNNSNTSIIGVINPKNYYINELFKDIAVCFSMAIYNKKHLSKTETMALTDSLTGIANRMAYKQDIRKFENSDRNMLACIFIDVNELHYFNNKYGHAAGDQMLVFIAEVLKNKFSDSHIYRIGGDEFLIFTEELSRDTIKDRLCHANSLIEEMKYHISIGIKYGNEKLDIEEMVNEAEKVMYEDKAKYYQHKEIEKVTNISERKINTVATGIKEIDACLSIMSMRYIGVYCVSLKTDTSVPVLAQSYFSMMLDETNSFSNAMKKYIHDIVKPEFQRTIINFLKYDVLEKQLKNGHNPRVSYEKIDGEKVTLSIYLMYEGENETKDTIWIFEKEEY